ncbi:MAG: helix-turn-helix transcriptional regulator [Proteobacteria bacterium]|nr:helix-turn-helix transcriptional regulator [Pseudomonadota bacterium]
MNDQVFDAIVGDFYRAATGAIEWDRALVGVQAAFGARASILHTLDLASGQLIGLHSGGPDLADAMLSYLREYYLIDPRRQRVIDLGEASIGRWLHCHEAFDDAFVARDRFFQHFLPAYDSRYNSSVSIPIADTVATAFILELPAERGPLDADEREMARRLGDHLREAMQAHQRTRSLMQQALAGHALLDAFPYPMWLIDDGRFITFENRAATLELDREQRAARRGNCLVLTRGRTDRMFLEHFDRLRQAEHGASAVVDLRATAADPPAWLHLSVLIPGVVLRAFGQRPLILATLFDPSHVSALDPFALANLFGLTPAEAKVAARLADGSTAEQIGALHGTAEATVRSQIKQVVCKLGATRSVDVVRMLRQGEVLWASVGGKRDSGPDG